MTVLTDFLAKANAPKSLGRFLKAVQIILFVLIGYILAKAALLFFNPEVDWTPLASPNSTATTVVASDTQSFDFSTDPFRVTPSDNGASVESDFVYDPNLDVPETSLNISVKGWIAGEFGSASLKTPDNKEASYRIGETVMEDVTLEAVTPNYIVLNVKGELQRLTFEREEQDMLLGQSKEAVAPEQISVSPSQVSQGKGQVNFDVEASNLLELVRLNPNFDQGRLTGYVVQPRGKEDVLGRFGLQAGDRLTAINGESLIEGRLDLQELALTLNDAKSARLSIVRNGRSQTVKIGR